jgi:hypothetical protein
MRRIDHVVLDQEIVANEQGRARVVGVNAAHTRCRHDHGCGALAIEELSNRALIRKIELLMSAQQQILVALLPQRSHHGRPDQSPVPGDINPRILSELHGALLVVLVDFVAFFGDQGIALGQVQI